MKEKMNFKMYEILTKGISLVLALTLLLSEPLYAASANVATEQETYCGLTDHVHTEECYSAPAVENIEISNTDESQDTSADVSDDASTDVSDDTSSDASEDTSTDVPEDTSSDVSDDTSSDAFEDTSSDASEDTSTDASDDTSADVSDDTSSDVSDDTSSNVSDDTSSDVSDDTSSDVSDDTSSDVSEDSSADASEDESVIEDEVMSDLAMQLLAADTLQTLHDLLMADLEATKTLTAEECTAVQTHADELLAAITEPTADDEEYYTLITDTLEMLMEEPEADAPVTLEIPAANTIYFDLSLGDVTINASTYSGSVYVYDGENYTSTLVSGTHNTNNIYYVFQSTETQRGYITLDDQQAVTGVVYPNIAEMTNWSATIDKNNDVSNVTAEWTTLAHSAEIVRTPTNHRIAVTGESVFNLTIDDLWSTYAEKSSTGGTQPYRTTGSISYSGGAAAHALKLTFIGDNRLETIHYGGSSSKLIIGGNSANDTLTVASSDGKANLNSGAIGGSDQSGHKNSQTIEITKGHIYAGSQINENGSGIGGGGNGNAIINITGGTITAVSASNGAAIGGGYGGSGVGGAGTVNISGGTVYAYNMSASNPNGIGVAIGGGSSRVKEGGEGNVTISGTAIVHAEVNHNGVAIGGGNSRDLTPNKGTVNLLGGTVTAVSQGAYSIGGGTGKNGFVGPAVVKILPEGITCNATYDQTYIAAYYNDDTLLFTYYCNITDIPYLGELSKDNHYFISWIDNEDKKITQDSRLEEGTNIYRVLWGSNPIINNTVYFDLTLGDVIISDTGYQGYIRDDQRGQTVLQTGQHNAENKYYIYQSYTPEGHGITGSNSVTVPPAPALAIPTGHSSWGSYITNNNSVDNVVSSWITAASNRSHTMHNVSIKGSSTFTVTLDDLWSKHVTQSESRTDGSFGYVPSGNGKMDLYFTGDNRLENLHYYSSSTANALNIAGLSNTDTLTVAATDNGKNHWCSAIGGSDSYAETYNMRLNGGIIFAGSRIKDNCTAIGAGGNGTSSIEINNATVTAVASTSGSAIGGGIGYNNIGGDTTVTINSGNVYAYNHGILLGPSTEIATESETSTVVPAVAIGGGSSIKNRGNANTTVTINNGFVFARSVHGAAIGGGGSAATDGGGATININNGTVIAISATDDVHGYKKDSANNVYPITQNDVPAGVSIGGGTGKSLGGNATINIHGGTILTGSIGGGKADTGNPLGYAKVSVYGGTTQGQVIMQATTGNAEHCSFNMSGGTIDNGNHTGKFTNSHNNISYEFQFLEEDGGAVCMKDIDGVTNITGGTIQNCRGNNGGAIYMSGGTFTMDKGSQGTTGTITNCQAKDSGGAVYMGGGAAYIHDGTIQTNTATVNGGGIAVNDGKIIMNGGLVNDNKAETGSGGGMYVSASGTNAVAVKVFSGILSNNNAAVSGGAVGMEGDDDSVITVQIGVNHEHTRNADSTILPFNHDDDGTTYTHNSCPVITGNKAVTSGGAFYISGGSTTNLNIYCLIENGNTATEDKDVHNEPLSDFLMVKGGKVLISTSEAPTYDDVRYDDTGWGRSEIGGSIHVTAGKLDLYGTQENPKLTGIRTIDLTSDADHYIDHRGSKNKVKISYHENFSVGGVIDSTQTAFDVEHGQPETIPTSLYIHEGYTIHGWNTNKNAEIGVTQDGWYIPGDTFTFYNPQYPDFTAPDNIILSDIDVNAENGITVGTNHYGNLTIYAIWEINGYTVKYEPNCDSYTGHMEKQMCTYNETYEYPASGYSRTGYLFKGWGRDISTPESERVQPGTEFRNLTSVKGEEIPFYAQWEKCTHTKMDGENTVSTISYSANGNVITQKCDQCEMEGTVTLTAQDAVYDKHSHFAELEYTNEAFWAETVTESITISYTGKKINSDADVDFPETCVNAGNYIASITLGTANATTTFTIAKADQPAPDERPTYVPPGTDGIVTIHHIENETSKFSGAPVEYLLRYSKDNTNVVETIEDQDSNIDGIQYMVSEILMVYGILARYAETDNYNASKEISAEAAFLFTGKINLTIIAEEGINFWPQNNTEGEMTICLSLWDGYDLPTNQFTFTNSFTDGNIVSDFDPNSISATYVPDTKWNYTLKATVTPSEEVHITMVISGAVKTPTINATALEEEHFRDFSGKNEVTISNDSAFTVRYDVTGYNSTVYGIPTLTFGTALPVGTTIILRDRTDGSYWYHNVDADHFTSISVNDFSKMGTILEGSNGKYVMPNGDRTLQFIVDFSHVEPGLIAKESEFTCTMSIGKNDESSIGQDFEAKSVTVNLSNVSFELTCSGTGPVQTANLKTTIGAAASKYANRDLALVITPTTALPMDASILVTIGKDSTNYLPTAGNFIIPLGDIVNMSQPQAITLELCSKMFPVGSANYSMTAKLMVSNSNADQSPTDGLTVASHELSFSTSKDNTGIRIKVDGDKRLFTLGESITAEVTTRSDVNAAYNVVVELHQEYNNTSFGNTALRYQQSDNNQYTFALNSGTLADGDYCIVAKLTDPNTGYAYSEARYYFILQKAQTN